MIKTIAFVIVLAVAGLLAFAATRPDSFRIERSTLIKASADKIFPHLNDFRQWEPWSPWEKADPALKRIYSGAPSGVGAAYEWQSDKGAGHGRMEITESLPPSRLVLKLHFTKPFEARNMVEFTLTPEGGATRVTQAMFGPSPFMSKLMGVFFNSDKMVGDKYEEGFASLKQLAEK
ncbi:SRPBCC family protein [Polaromonas sp.]|uniref:SRPBCC family protein n=1 Tax=Polaromonas sp. TaxID=1869339 RepID=UPI00286A1728|nr:SRPBCC family protein [Polaromonas sp.]